jgi:hypothetical protein
MGEKTFLPILMVGQKASLRQELLTAFAGSMNILDSELADEARKASRRKSTTDSEIVDLFERAGRIAERQGFAGILLIIDEFGKYLEHATESTSDEIFIMQALGEAAARSDPPLVLITILHSAFADYLTSIDRNRRAEWQKVQGRFTDIAFIEPPEQFLRLMGAALQFDEEFVLTQRSMQEAIAKLATSGALVEAANRLPLDDLLPACAPLHPLTALILWPLFRSTLSQNERSFFAFIVDRSPFGFHDYLATTSNQGNRTKLYPLHYLYDYLVNSLSEALLVGLNARRWAEIGNALDRLPADAPVLSKETIKTVGLLSIFGASIGLKASKETILLAFSAEPNKAVLEAIKYLQNQSILVYRRYEDSFGLWEGSDIDLDEAYAIARKQIVTGKLADRLEKVIDLRPIVARAHYIRKGTLRYLSVRVIDGNEAANNSILRETTDSSDGQVIYVLSESTRHRKQLLERVLDFGDQEQAAGQIRIWAFPKPMARLEELISEVETWGWMRKNISELQGDPVARSEVRAHEQQALRFLQDAAGESLGLRGYAFQPSMDDWVYRGQKLEFRTSVEFQRWLSDLFDDEYKFAPELFNELLNRDNLSSAAAAAQRRLIEAMLNHEAHETLGIQGYPAEYSMYHSLLRNGGFHRLRNGAWGFGAPKGVWVSVWKAMKQFLRRTKKGRVPVVDLMSELQAPPYGLRSGPIPILICALILAERETIALYEEGVLVPELRIEVFERMLRAAERFEIQSYAFSKQDRDTLRQLSNNILEITGSAYVEDKLLVPLVKDIILFVASLPPYSRSTRRLTPKSAIKVRDALVRAGDPYDLVFHALPEALDIAKPADDPDRYGQELGKALAALQRAYPSLLDFIEDSTRHAFSLVGNSAEARNLLLDRTSRLTGLSADPGISLLVNEFQRLGNRDWREIVGRVINDGNPPDRWRDRDLVDFQLKLQQVAADFIRLEELVAERGGSVSTRIFRVGMLDGRHEEYRVIVAISDENLSEVDSLADELVDLLSKNGHSKAEGRKIVIAALAKATSEIMRRSKEDANDE